MTRQGAVLAIVAAGAMLVAGSGLPQERAERRDQAALRAAAVAFLDALAPDHRAQATAAFDDPGRCDWHFIPRERRGLPLGAMSDGERTAAQALLHAGLSSQGYLKANGVMTLETVLREQALAAGQDPSLRDPGKYYFTIFGDPHGEAPFLVRFEGHHVALNFTSVPAAGTATAPLFFGANPGRVPSGALAGFRLLAGEEDGAWALVRSLDAAQRAQAVIAKEAPPDVVFGPGQPADPGSFAGIAFSDLAEPQQKLLLRVVNEFVGNLEPDLARAEQLRLAKAGVEKIHFAWAGGTEPGQGHYWRLHGPTFVLEFDNTQNGANHVHALWRDPQNEFAARWLTQHLQEESGAAKVPAGGK